MNETETATPGSLDHQARRDRLRAHWEQGVAFNKACGFVVERWDYDGVELRLSFRNDLGGHPGVFHGGVLAALIDAAGCGSVAAGHDFDLGSSFTTIGLSVQYLGVDRGSDAVASGRCTRRGRSVNYADVVVRSAAGKLLAQGLVTVNVSAGRTAGGG